MFAIDPISLGMDEMTLYAGAKNTVCQAQNKLVFKFQKVLYQFCCTHQVQYRVNLSVIQPRLERMRYYCKLENRNSRGK